MNYSAGQCHHLGAHFEKNREILEENIKGIRGFIVSELW